MHVKTGDTRMPNGVETSQRAGLLTTPPKLSAAAREGEARPAALNTRRERITGWARACADDVDPIVVDRLIDGEPATCTAWERRAAVIALRHRGWSQSRIADHLTMPERQVVRDLDRAGMTAAGSLTEARDRARHRRPLVAELYHAGARVCEIAALLDVTRTVVSRDIAAMGLRMAGAA